MTTPSATLLTPAPESREPATPARPLRFRRPGLAAPRRDPPAKLPVKRLFDSDNALSLEDHNRFMAEERARTLRCVETITKDLDEAKALHAVVTSELASFNERLDRMRERLAEAFEQRNKATQRAENAARVLRYHRRVELERRGMSCAFDRCPPLDERQAPMFEATNCACTTSAGERHTAYACGTCMMRAVTRLPGGAVGTACPRCRQPAQWALVDDGDTLPERYEVDYALSDD